MRYRCWSCKGEGKGISASGAWDDCSICAGTGAAEDSRIVVWTRRKPYLGFLHPAADKNSGYEKWKRMSVEIPPEFVPLLEQAHRKRMGVNYGYGKRSVHAQIVRAALFAYLQANLPEEDLPIDIEAEEIEDVIVRAAIGSGDSE